MSKKRKKTNRINLLEIQLLINEVFKNHTLEMMFRKYRILLLAMYSVCWLTGNLLDVRSRENAICCDHPWIYSCFQWKSEY